MYDTFEPFQTLQKQNFDFMPSRYEVWIGGEKINSGKTELPLSAKVILLNDSEKVEVTFGDKVLQNELSPKNIFDAFVTANDRLQLITVPEQTNAECMGIIGFKMILGATRPSKDFNRTEPYCCNLFLQNGVIDKITFSFSNPEKLIEFYSEKRVEATSDIRNSSAHRQGLL